MPNKKSTILNFSWCKQAGCICYNPHKFSLYINNFIYLLLLFYVVSITTLLTITSNERFVNHFLQKKTYDKLSYASFVNVYANPNTTARIITIVHPTNNTPWNLIMNFAQLPHSILAAARAPSKHPEVGTMKFVKPSPNW